MLLSLMLLGSRGAAAAGPPAREAACGAAPDVSPAFLLHVTAGMTWPASRSTREGWLAARVYDDAVADVLLYVDHTDKRVMQVVTGWAVNRGEVDVPGPEGHGGAAVRTRGAAPGTWVTLAARCANGAPDLEHAIQVQTDRRHVATFLDLPAGEYWFLVREPQPTAGTVAVVDGAVARVIAEPARGQSDMHLSDPDPVRVADPGREHTPPGILDPSPSMGASRGVPFSLPTDPRALTSRVPEIEFQTIGQAELAILWPEFVQ